MKKIFLSLIVLVSVVSCSKEIIEKHDENTEYSLSAKQSSYDLDPNAQVKFGDYSCKVGKLDLLAVYEDNSLISNVDFTEFEIEIQKSGADFVVKNALNPSESIIISNLRKLSENHYKVD